METSTPDLSIDKLAFCVGLAAKLETTGEYEEAFSVLQPFWRSLEEFPRFQHLPIRSQGYFLRLAGSIAGRLGSVQQIEIQEHAQELLREAKSKFIQCGDDEGLAETYLTLGILDWRRGYFDSAEDNLKVVSSLVKNNQLLDLKAKTQLAVVFHKKNRLSQALGLLKEVEPYISSGSDFLLQGNYYNHKALILKDIQPTDECVNLFQKAYINFKKAKHFRFCLAILNNISRFYSVIENFTQAHIYIHKAIRLAKKIKDLGYEGIYHDTEAQIFLTQKNYREAIRSADKAIALLEKGENAVYLLEALSTKLKAEIALNSPSSSQTLFRCYEVIDQQRLGDISRQKLNRLQKELAFALSPSTVRNRPLLNKQTFMIPPAICEQYSQMNYFILPSNFVFLPAKSLVFYELKDSFRQGDIVVLFSQQKRFITLVFFSENESPNSSFLVQTARGLITRISSADYTLLGRVIGFCPPEMVKNDYLQFYPLSRGENL